MDREKIIKQIANCVHDGLCDECEYKKYTACRHFMIADAIALLKEQQKLIDEITQRRMNNGAFD